LSSRADERRSSGKQHAMAVTIYRFKFLWISVLLLSEKVDSMRR